MSPNAPSTKKAEAQGLVRGIRERWRKRSEDKKKRTKKIDRVIDGVGAGTTAGGLVWAVAAADPTGFALAAVGVVALGGSWWRKRQRKKQEEQEAKAEAEDQAALEQAEKLLDGG